MADRPTSPADYRVLVILDTIEVGGPGKGILQFCQNAPDCVAVTIANFSYPGKREPLFNRAACAENLDVILMEQRHRLDAKPVAELASAAADRKIDIVQSHSFKAHIAAAWISRRLKLPWVAFAHGWTAENRRVRFYNFLERRLLRLADRVCVVSDRLRTEFVAAGIDPQCITVVQNAVERPLLVPGERPRETVPIILCVGRLSHEKGQDRLISAMAVLADLPWRLLIVGEGPEREALKKLVHDQGLDKRIGFAGHVTAMQEYYAKASLLVVPSRSEGIPNVVLEAFGHGVPVVACSVGGIPEIIDDGETGWLCRQDASDLSKVIASVLENPDLASQAATRAWTDLYPRFSPSERAKRIVELHQQLLIGTEWPKSESTPRICVALYSFDIGGSEMLAVSLMKHFIDQGAKVSCVATRRGHGPLQDQLEAMGVACLALDLERYSRLRRYYLKRNLAAWLRQQKVSFLHVHHFSVLADIRHAAEQAAVARIVVTEHTAHPVLQDRSYRRLVRRLAPSVSLCTAINDNVRQAIAQVSGLNTSDIKVIENGVDTERYVPGETAETDQSIHIGWLGRMHKDKDILTGLKAFSVAMNRTSKRMHLLVAGDGEQMSEARDFVRKSQLEDNVSFLGFVQDASRFMQRCHVYLMSSRTEGTPLSLLEAMSCGLPVVATAVGGIPSVVSSETARLAKSGDSDGLAAALVEIADNAELRVRMGRASRELALRRFADGRMKTRYMNAVMATGSLD